jgi:hypothetical protein
MLSGRGMMLALLNMLAPWCRDAELQRLACHDFNKQMNHIFMIEI